jgi:hypothetical protein
VKDIPLIAEFEIVAAAHALMIAHDERLRQHVTRIKELTMRLTSHVNRGTFFPEASTAADPRREQERLTRVTAVVTKRRT